MGKVFKGLFLLLVGFIALVTSYLGWLLYMPVSEIDVSARIWNTCMVGQLTTYGRSHYTSCSCFSAGLNITETNAETFSEQAEALRQVVVAQYSAYWNGNYDVNIIPREVQALYWKAAPFVNRLKAVDSACKVRVSGR